MGYIFKPIHVMQFEQERHAGNQTNTPYRSYTVKVRIIGLGLGEMTQKEVHFCQFLSNLTTTENERREGKAIAWIFKREVFQPGKVFLGPVALNGFRCFYAV